MRTLLIDPIMITLPESFLRSSSVYSSPVSRLRRELTFFSLRWTMDIGSWIPSQTNKVGGLILPLLELGCIWIRSCFFDVVMFTYYGVKSDQPFWWNLHVQFDEGVEQREPCSYNSLMRALIEQREVEVVEGWRKEEGRREEEAGRRRRRTQSWILDIVATLHTYLR